MINKLNILRKIWGQNKKDCEETNPESKQKEYREIKFYNHENPENSFTFDVANPQHIYYTGTQDEKKTPFEKELGTEVIMEPKPRHKKSYKEKESNGDHIFMGAQKSSIILSQPRVFTWQKNDAYVYRVESKYYNDGERPDLEFVIYIPIDTAVKWLNTTMDKSPDYISEHPNPTERNVEQAVSKSPEEERKYGVEQDEGSKQNATVIWKNEKSNDSSDSDEDEDDNDEKNKKQPKSKKIKEKKVKGPRKNKKKARTVITTYEADEDEISLGRLRPQETPKKPVKIMEKDHI